jgi:translation initiation factor 2B subunit (eIF-2B alpha/beta/delta family)
MRPKENIEKFVKVNKPHVTTGRRMDKQTLNDSFAAMEQTIRAKSADHKPSTPRIITLSRMMKLTAAAAVIIVGISFFIAQQDPSEQGITTKLLETIESPSQIMTMKSLKIAYRRGGIEGIENQCEKALKILGPQPASISLGDLFNGSKS